MHVSTDKYGKHIVLHEGKTVAGPFDTHAEAWRFVDRMVGDPLSRSEHTAEWQWKKRVDESFTA